MPTTREDRDDLADLFNRYAFALDKRRWGWLEQVFTEDAVMSFSGGGEVPGRGAIISMIRGFMDQCAATHHLLANHHATIDGDHAEAFCYVRAHHAAKGGEGRFEESLASFTAQAVRTDAGWRFAAFHQETAIALGDFGVFGIEAPAGVTMSGWAVSGS
jgi:uncharacterized protein (TIGR02246 family)